jgi:poly-gamma-glutamate capsule biosynthesis protein CapA/YwtB (metallophosphatase superfamily)
MQPQATSQPFKPGKAATASVIGVGDIMLGSNYPDDSLLPPEQGDKLLREVEPFLHQADVVFGNLEGVIMSRETLPGKPKTQPGYFAFKSPDSYAMLLRKAGFNMVSLANNHSNDFGNTGRRNTTKLLATAGIHFAGLPDCPYTILEKNSIRYGFCAFAASASCNPLSDTCKIKRIVNHLDSVANVVIVSLHIGGEGVKFRHITRKREYFAGENRGNPYQLARIAIDAGADIIFCHGPHVTRAIDLYRNRFIAYSLGNFATYRLFSLNGPMGFAPIIRVNTDRTGKFISANIIPIKQTGRGVPCIDSCKQAVNELISLTNNDIPETNLSIGSSGEVRCKIR